MSDRLISADKVAEAIDWLNEYDFVIWHDVMECIDKVPAVDIERHGKWLERNSGLLKWIRCSVCNCRQHYTNKTNYCPNCGAKMDREKDRK